MLRRIVAVVVSTRNSSFPSHPRIRLYSSRNLLRERKFQAFDMIRYASTEKTKVEKTLEMLKDDLKQEQSEKDRSKERDLNKTIAIKVPLTKRIMNELKHYYHGFRLLALEVRLSSRYLWRVARGHSLMRRERQQLVRTVSDLFRLLPFSVFIIVPFMEFALPLFIKLFPNMLPSTFKDATKEEENLRRKLKVRLEMAKFLQDTIAEIGLVRKSQSTDQSASKAFEFAEFMKKVRTEGGYVSNAELFKFTKLFEDELTLDNLSLSSLRALCRMLDIQPLGSPEILRFQLNLKLRELKADDKQIALEGGVDVLNINDLQTACRARGMRSFGMSEFRLKSQLKQWLELSLNDNVPPSLLLLSRAIYVPEDITFADRLKALLSSLPSSIAEQARQKLTELEGDKINYKARLDLIREIEIGLQKERESMEETKKIVVESVQESPAKLVADNTSTLLGSEPIVSGAEGVAAAEVGVKQPSVAGKDLETLENIIHGGVVLEAKHDIDELKEKLSGRREDLMEVDALMNDLTETKGAKILHRRINHIIANVDSLVAKLEEKRRHIAETVADPAIEDENKAKSNFALHVDDVLKSLQSLQNLSYEKRKVFEEIARAFDDDTDGIIDPNIVLQIIDLLSKHKDIKISAIQIKKMVEMLKKEEKMEALEKFFEGISPYPPSSLTDDISVTEESSDSKIDSDKSVQNAKLLAKNIREVHSPLVSPFPIVGEKVNSKEKTQHQS